ncbi:respiratory nitrate reductase subunit gamma [Actinacidiphila alni]|uniref:respiratory nitrate reductase subunit gamma n=1 Tax=Actinacidiphila alni TaxID=380248 RepID=UPI0033C3FB6D
MTVPAQPLTLAAEAGTGGILLWVVVPYVAPGISEHTYHIGAVVLGTIAGVATLAGPAILIYRRRTVGPVFSATTRNDKAMYVSLTATIALGLSATVVVTGAPILFRLHAISAMLLFAAWPFTRLVHMLTAPVGYVTRPYIVYRSRDARLGTRAPRRGWERVGPDR